MKSTKERKERRREHQQEKGRHRRHKGEKKGRGSKDRNSISFRIRWQTE
jgi:hypothetical protein